MEFKYIYFGRKSMNPASRTPMRKGKEGSKEREGGAGVQNI
jgi:hypothetical protein